LIFFFRLMISCSLTSGPACGSMASAAHAFDGFGQVILRHVMAVEGVRVLVALSVTQTLGIAVGVLQMKRHVHFALSLDLLERAEVGGGCVALGRGREVQRRFDDGIHALGQTDKVEGLGGRAGDDQPHRIRQPDVLAGQDQQSTQDKARVLAGV
jgi:hypothetical protein